MGPKYPSFDYGIMFDYPETTCKSLENPDIAGIGVLPPSNETSMTR